MNKVMIMTAVLSLLAGIGVFLVACSMMSSNLEAIGSNKLKQLFAKASGSKLLGVAIGAAGTAAIQSSGATTVMVIGFVNAGILSLAQAATMIYGANIGTTITGQIVAFGMSGGNTVSSSVMFSAMAGIGAFLSMFSKNERTKTIGAILTGFGMLFVGLGMMSGSMEAFAKEPALINFLARLNNALLLILFGMILTAIVQSSSVMTSVAITMVVAGLITLDQGIFLTMGSNIGSCVVALIAGFSGSVSAKRTAAIHFLFNVCGVFLFLILSALLSTATGGTVGMGSILARVMPLAPQIQLAMFHTIFNLCTVVLALPLTGVLVGITEKVFPDIQADAEDADQPKMYYLNRFMMKTPSVAIAQLKREIENMAKIAIENFYLAIHLVCTLDYTEIDRFRKNENELNYLNHELVPYLVELSDKALNGKDRTYVTDAFRSIADLERIGDYAENIVEYADNLRDMGERFSEQAVSEINELKSLVEILFSQTMNAYHREDLSELQKADETEDRIDEMTIRMSEQHVTRMTEGKCSPNTGAQFLELTSDAERIADHLINVAGTIRHLK